MKVKFEALAKNGTYKSAQGVEKTRWHKCGVVFEGDKGMSIKLDSLPINFDGWISLFPPKDQERPTVSDIKDDIPW